MVAGWAFSSLAELELEFGRERRAPAHEAQIGSTNSRGGGVGLAPMAVVVAVFQRSAAIAVTGNIGTSIGRGACGRLHRRRLRHRGNCTV